jgi:ParB family chromosome partitioning protein
MAKADMSAVLKQRAEENFANVCREDTADYDILFGLGIDGERSEYAVTKLPIIKLIHYGKHPFRIYDGNKLLDLAVSIKEHGLLHPIIVRPIAGGKYEILAGHNRVEASKLNGEPMIPAIIVNVDDNRAAMIVVETNLRQREKLLPSEKAFAYKLQLDAIRHQGQKTENGIAETSNDADSTTCTQIEHKPKSRDKVAALNGVDRNEIQRYTRLTFLIPDMLRLVDENKLPFIAGVELSYLNESQQEVVRQYYFVNKNTKPGIEAARTIRDWADVQNPLNDAADVERCLEKQMPRKRSVPKGSITFKRKTFAPYLDRIPKGADLESLFLEFLKERFG